MSEKSVVAVVLPTTAYILRLSPPPVRKMIEAGRLVSFFKEVWVDTTFLWKMADILSMAILSACNYRDCGRLWGGCGTITKIIMK